MSVVDFFTSHPVFSRDEFVQFLKQRGAPSVETANVHLKRYLASGRIARVKRGVYVAAGPGETAHRGALDFPLVASRLVPDAVLAYHTALEVHGYAQSLFERLFFLTASTKRSGGPWPGSRSSTWTPFWIASDCVGWRASPRGSASSWNSVRRLWLRRRMSWTPSVPCGPSRCSISIGGTAGGSRRGGTSSCRLFSWLREAAIDPETTVRVSFAREYMRWREKIWRMCCSTERVRRREGEQAWDH